MRLHSNFMICNTLQHNYGFIPFDFFSFFYFIFFFIGNFISLIINNLKTRPCHILHSITAHLFPHTSKIDTNYYFVHIKAE